MPTTGLSMRTVDRIILDAGAVFRNLNVNTLDLSNPVGATRGGASFTVEREDREIEVDGARGPIMQLKRTVRHVASLEVTFLELSQDLLLELTRGTAAPHEDNADLIEIVPSNIIAPEDYFANVALVADVMNQDTPIILMLKNVLVEGEWGVETNDIDEGQITVTFQAHYDLADQNEVPYAILYPAAIDAES